jgi:hypothetical protein
MNRSRHTIKEENGIKIWRETRYHENGLETTFFVDAREDGYIVLRQCYKNLNEALDHYYSLKSSSMSIVARI